MSTTPNASVHLPKRVQLRRVKGWRMPPNTVKVCRPGKFGNPFLVTNDRTRADVVTAFNTWLRVDGCSAGMYDKKRDILDVIASLRGKNLACFCALDHPCHADVLLDLANAQVQATDRAAGGSPATPC